MNLKWQEVIPHLTKLFLQWKSCNSNLISLEDASEYDFKIDILNLDMAIITKFVLKCGLSAVDVFLLDGYLDATSNKLTIAVALNTLEVYRTMHLVEPSLSVEVFTKIICYKYCIDYHSASLFSNLIGAQIPYRQRFRRVITDTFDVYLTIVENVRN